MATNVGPWKTSKVQSFTQPGPPADLGTPNVIPVEFQSISAPNAASSLRGVELGLGTGTDGELDPFH